MKYTSEVKSWYHEIGAKGGKSKSPAKQAASRLNGCKPKLRKTTEKISVASQAT